MPPDIASNLIPPRQNSKSETMSNVPNSKLKTPAYKRCIFRILEIRILNLFRISKFELRISEGKLDQFVNIAATKKPCRNRRCTPIDADFHRIHPRASACIGGFIPIRRRRRRSRRLSALRKTTRRSLPSGPPSRAYRRILHRGSVCDPLRVPP